MIVRMLSAWMIAGLLITSGFGDEATFSNPPKGALIIVGGGGLPSTIVDRFMELAGGNTAKIVVIPTASEKPDPEERLVSRWKGRGAVSVKVLHTTDRKVADTEEFVAELKEASGVWIGGGSQTRLSNVYAGTAVERELKALLARGGVVGGTSAGAAIQCQTMIAHSKPVPVMGVGFDLLPGAIIDQHFLARNRMNRLLYAVQDHPGLVGIGIDEATAIEVHGNECRVLGDSFVTLVLGTGTKRPLDIQTFSAGKSFTISAAE